MAEPKKEGKKQIPLRLSPKLYAAIAAWAEDDFRSVNGQIEYLLTECVASAKRTANMSPMRSTSPQSWTSNNINTLTVPFVGAADPCGPLAPTYQISVQTQYTSP